MCCTRYCINQSKYILFVVLCSVFFFFFLGNYFKKILVIDLLSSSRILNFLVHNYLLASFQIEKALHEIRAESAETKVASEIKLAEARTMMDDAQRRLTEGDAKLHAAESLQAEASRYHSAAERKLQDVEAREDTLRRRMLAFKSEYVFDPKTCFHFLFTTLNFCI